MRPGGKIRLTTTVADAPNLGLWLAKLVLPPAESLMQQPGDRYFSRVGRGTGDYDAGHGHSHGHK